MVSVKATEIKGIPSGMIMIWSGSIASIPEGWNLCDGTNGTPDLTALFVRHADGLLHQPGATGGTNTHTHTVAGTTANNGISTTVTPSGATNVASSPHTHTFSTTSGSTATIPPFMALCYVMKL